MKLTGNRVVVQEGARGAEEGARGAEQGARGVNGGAGGGAHSFPVRVVFVSRIGKRLS